MEVVPETVPPVEFTKTATLTAVLKVLSHPLTTCEA